jgi:hypothetical protein
MSGCSQRSCDRNSEWFTTLTLRSILPTMGTSAPAYRSTLPRTSQTLAIPGLSFCFVCPNMIRVLIAKAKYEGQHERSLSTSLPVERPFAKEDKPMESMRRGLGASLMAVCVAAILTGPFESLRGQDRRVPELRPLSSDPITVRMSEHHARYTKLLPSSRALGGILHVQASFCCVMMTARVKAP